MVCGRSNDDPLKQHGIFINVYGGLNKNATQRLKESSIVGGVTLWKEVGLIGGSVSGAGP